MRSHGKGPFGDAAAYPAATFLDTEIIGSWLDES